MELKSAKGELKKAQKQMQLMCMNLGHEYHKVKSYKRFLELAEGG